MHNIYIYIYIYTTTHGIYIYISYCLLPTSGQRPETDMHSPWGGESVMSESPSAGGLKKGSIARAQEGINSKGNIIDIECPV